MRLHDIIFRIMVQYLCGNNQNKKNNKTLVKLLSLNARFYGLSDIFIKKIVIDHPRGDMVRHNKPYGWNKVYSLYLTNIENRHLTDFYCHLHSLSLQYCPTLTDVSSLGRCRLYSLTIGYAPNLSDISALSGLHRLKLYGCPAITDISPLKNLHTLILSCCEGIRDVSALSGLKSLSIYGSRQIDNTLALKNIPYLMINGVKKN